MRVFIVDDESLAISRMQQLLKTFPEVVLVGHAKTMEDSVCSILKTRPDLVFIDVEVGNHTGFEIIDEVTQKGFRPKYIVVSGYSQYAIAALRSKVDDYLLKPLDLNDLKASLIRVVYNKSEDSEILYNSFAIDLTPREKTILSKMLKGMTSKEIAIELFLSSHTIDTFRRKILKKFGVRSTPELLAIINLRSQ